MMIQRMKFEKYWVLSVPSNSFMNSEYSSHNFSKFSWSWDSQVPLALRYNSSRIYWEYVDCLMKLFNFSEYFCLYWSSLFGLFALRLIDKNFRALSFEPNVGYLGRRYPNWARHFIKILLRWCSKNAEQSFLFAIFLRSLFFSN